VGDLHNALTAADKDRQSDRRATLSLLQPLPAWRLLMLSTDVGRMRARMYEEISSWFDAAMLFFL